MTFYDIIDVICIDSVGGSAGAPTEPVSVDQLKSRLIIDFNDDDAYLAELITSCRETIEGLCHISITEKIVSATIDTTSCYRGSGYSNSFQELPYGPVKTFVSAGYMDQDSNLVTLDLNDGYFLRKGEIRVPGSYDNLLLSYVAGYAECPKQLQEAILLECVFRYENRGDKSNRYAQQNVGLCEAAEYKCFKFRSMAWQ